MTTNSIYDAGKPITAAYNDALVALGLRTPPAPPPAREAVPLDSPRSAPLKITVDMSTRAGSVWKNRFGDFGVTRAFQYVELDQGIAENAKAQYSTVAPLGRPEAILSRVGNTNRTLQLVVELRHTGELSLDESVIIPARWLKSLEYPITVATSGSGVLSDPSRVPPFKSYNPPPVIVQLGGVVAMRAILTCDIRWGGPWSYEGGRGSRGTGQTLLPHSASIIISLTQVTKFTGDPESYNYSLTPWGLGSRP